MGKSEIICISFRLPGLAGLFPRVKRGGKDYRASFRQFLQRDKVSRGGFNGTEIIAIVISIQR